MAQLEGRIAWVTGAGSGIGEAAALMLADVGAAVVLTGRRREPLEGVAARIHQQGGPRTFSPAILPTPPRCARSATTSPRKSAGSTS